MCNVVPVICRGALTSVHASCMGLSSLSTFRVWDVIKVNANLKEPICFGVFTNKGEYIYPKALLH